MLKRTVPVKYKGTDKIDGVEVYEFNYTVSDQDAEVVSNIDGKYSMDKTMWVEPNTGAIIKQEQHEVRTLENGDPLLDLNHAFTDAQVKGNAADAETNLGRPKEQTSELKHQIRT